MNRLARIIRVAIAATFLALPLAAQTDSVFTDDFQSYGTQKNPPGWVDTSIGSSKPEAGGLFKTWPDPIQGNKGTNVVFGSKSSSGKADTSNNPRIGIFSTYTTKTFSGSGRFEFSGRFIRTSADSRIGVTFFSSYPEKDSYYLIGLWAQPSGKLTMQLYGFGGPAPTGTVDSNFTPDPNKWYRFSILADDSNGKTTIRAKFWLDTNTEPSAYNIDASDSAAGRLKSGRIGFWTAVRGENYIDDLSARSPVDHTAPVIRILESGQTLADNTRFNRAPSPEISVTDDNTPAANIIVTAQLDGQPFTSKTAVTGQGNHILTVHATDSVGNSSDATVHFFVDTIPPAVTVVSPKDGSMTANDVTVVLQVADASLPYTVSATLDGAAFNVANPVTTEGKHTLAMTVTDAVGLSTVVPPIAFTIDKSNPVYVLKEGNNSFPNSGFVFDRDLSAHVDVQDLTPATVKLTLDGAAYVENTPITAEGDHTIAGSVSDSVGHTVTIPAHTFTIDKSAPVVTITENDAPLTDFYDRSVTPVIKVTDFSDSHITATINGQPFTTGTTLSAEQKYTLTGTVTDSANHSTPFGPIVFYIDLSAPVVSLTANGSPFPPSPFVFDSDVAADAAIADLTPTTSAITLDGANVTLPLTITTEKVHKLTAVVTDKVHKSTTVTADFVIDKTPPSVDVQESGGTLQDGRFFNRTVTPVIVVTDSTDTTVAATLDGQPFTSGTVVTAEGLHTIAGNVTDAAKHKVDIGPVTFTIDVTKPVGVFKEGDADFPDGKSVNRDVTAHVAVTDASPVTVTVLLDGAPYVENAPITTEQSHTLSATLLDKAGNSNTVPPVTFRIDRTPPTVALLADGSAFPADYVFGKDVVADVRVEDASPTTTKGTLDGNQISFPFTISTEGQHTISATATDAAGLSTTTPAIHFTVDKTPPAVVVLENGVAAVPNKVFGVNVTVTFTIDQGVSQRTAYPTLDGNPYVAGTPVTAEGVHTIAGEVKSAAGLSTPIPSTVFTIDKTAPVVKLLNRDKPFPASGFHFNSDVVPVVDCTDNLTHCTAELLLNNSAVSNNQPVTAEGNYTLAVTGTDEAGNKTTLDPVAFTIDKTPPAVTITSHTDGQIVTEPQAVFSGATDDAVTINVNGVAADIDFNNKTYKTPTALPLLEGENIIAVTGIDRAGNPGTKSVRVILDTRNPSLVVKTPVAGACITDADLIVSGSVTDPNISKVSITAGTTTVDNALDATKQGFSAKFTAIAEGTQNVVIVATDTQGHRTQAQFSVFVDRGTPVIEVLESNAPFTAQVINHPVALTLRARDIDPNVQLSATLDNTQSYVSGAIIAGDGSHRVDVLASDCAGHQATVTVQFAIDTVAPVISSIVPANGTTIAAAPQSITGTVSGDTVRVELEGRGISATPATNGDFTLGGATFAEGLNSFTLRATDAAGNVTRIVYTFIVKSHAPNVEIFEGGSPLPDGKVFNRPVTLVVHSDDVDATITALLNDATYDGTPITGDNHYRIEGRASDKYNHTASVTRTFIVDMTPPAVHITSPAPGASTTSSVTVSGTAGDAVSVTVNGVNAQLTNGNFTASGIPLTDIGENAILVAATDAAGNVGRDSVIVNVLGAGPGIIIFEPTDLSLTNRPRIDVAGRVLSPTDDNHVTIGSARAAVDAVGGFRFNGYQLADGDNTISISARGLNGQTATAQVHVTADFIPPALTIMASGQTLSDNKQFPQAVTITVNATDNRGDVTKTLSLDGSVRTEPVDVSTQGGHVLTAIARDKAGNETRVDRTFFIGTNTAGSQGCHIDSTDPVDGTVISTSAVTVAGHAPGAATVTVAGVNATVADGTFAASIDLPSEGANSIQVQCADAGGLTATRTISLIRATGNPSIDITSPAEGFTTGDKTIAVSGTLSSDVDSADVNGKNVTITGTTFTVSGISLANGLNTLVAHAHNKAGRTASDSVRVRSIQTAPDVAISSPLSDYQTGDTKVTVSGTYSNLDSSTIALSGQAGIAPAVHVAKVSDTTGSFTINDVPLAAGVQSLTITARNVLGAVATSTVKVTVAANTPSITITSPLDNAYLPGDQPINVAGSFDGSTTPHIDINGNLGTINATTYSGTTTFSTASDVTPIVARLTDANGNSAYAAVRVNRLNAPFAVKEAFPAPNAQEVDTGVIVLISFNAPLDLSTLGAITLKASDGTTVTGTTLVDDTVLTFAPTALLKSGTTYTIAASTSLKNAAGMPLATPFSSSFTTASSAPTTKPSIDPIGAVDCAKPLLITGTAPAFARLRMDAATLVLTGTADANGKFSFTYPFNGQSGYQVARVRVVGADGSLSPADEVTFRYDCAAPQVVGAAYDRNVNTLTITFSKPVDQATLVVGSGGSIVLTTNNGTTSSGTFSVSGSNVVVTPSDDLRTATFTLTITDAVKDLGGTKLVSLFSLTFSITGDDLPPAPGDGSGFISGEVYDANTGRPLTGANVTIIVPATAFAKTPGATASSSANGRYTIIGTANTGRVGELAPHSSKVSSNSMSVAVNSATESRGRYTLPLPEGAHTIQATADGYTSVWRQIVVPAGAGVVPIDIRLARRGDVKTSDGTTGLSLSNGGDTVVTRHVDATLPAGAVPSGSKAALTAVGAQSLAGLLPLGWSPLASAELAVIDGTGAPVTHAALGSNASITFTLPSSEVTAANQVLSLVQYDEDRDEWRVLLPVMTGGANDKWTATIANSGAYAVVYHDKSSAGLAEPPAAVGGATLQAATGTCAPCGLVKKSFEAEPKTITPSGRTVATLQIISDSSTKFPSGTAVQAYVNEELHLPGGTTIVDPPFAADVLLYRNLAGDIGFGQFYLAPSARATQGVLSDGVDHIQILQYPGRLDRGTLIGAEGGRVPGDEAVAVEIPSSATTVSLHASVSSLSTSDLAAYGTIAGFRIVGGFSLTMARSETPAPQDLDGDGILDPIPAVVLNRPARATVAIDTTQLPAPGSLIVLAEVVDHPTWGRIIRLADPMTAIDAPQAGVTTVRYTTRSIDPADLPVDGVVREGRYLILAAEAPIAYATGAVRGGAGGAYLADARLTSFTLPASALLGVADNTRNTGVFAIPVSATPAAGFMLLPKHAATGDGAPINITPAPAPDTVVKLGDVVLTPQSPTLVSTSPTNGATIDVAAPLVVTMTFSSAIDAASAKKSITVLSTDGSALVGTVNATGTIVSFTPSRALFAATRYVVTIDANLRGTNGAAIGNTLTFSFSTNAVPVNGTINPLKVHITIPDNGVSRVYGDAGALPGGDPALPNSHWRVVPVRANVDFITRYQTDVAGDGSFSLLVGNGVDTSDRISVDDVIDLRVINPAGNVAAVIRLTPFITADGKGFIAPFGVQTNFRSIEGIEVSVPAGTFDEPQLVNVTFGTPDVFNSVPNVANEIGIRRTVKITFDGVAKQRIDISIPIGGLPVDRDYFLGWLGQSAWGPRIAIVDTMRVDGGNFTSSYPPEAAVKKIIASANSGLRGTSNAGLTDMQIKGCLVGVRKQGDYAFMDWEAPAIGGPLGFAIVNDIANQVDVMSDLFQAIYLPDFAFSSKNNCAAIPIIKGKPFTLTGVDPSTGVVEFKTAYDPIPITDPGVVNIPSPDPDKRGPYPVFGLPYRIETIDFTGTKYDGRGYKLELQTNGPNDSVILLKADPDVKDVDKIAEHAKIRIYNVTKSRWSSPDTVVDEDGQFPQANLKGDRGDQLVVYIGTADIGVDSRMNIVFSEPIDHGTATTGVDEKTQVNNFLHKRLKFERVVKDVPTEITTDATFTLDSQYRRLWISLPAPLTRGATYRLTFKGSDGRIKDTAGNEFGVAKDPKTSAVIGDAATDVSLEFIVRDNPIDVLTSFKLQPRSDYPGGALRDLAQSGNLAFVSALDAGLLVYDLSDPDALKKDVKTGKQPDPYSLVPARWIDPIDGSVMSGASGYDQYWAVTTDQHNRVFAAGFLSTLASVRIFKVEDFVKAHNDADGTQCSGLPATPESLKKSNCKFYGAGIIGWRPGYAANLPESTNLAMTDYPEAYPRKIQIASQDETTKFENLDKLAGGDVSLENKKELGTTSGGPPTGNFKFNIRIAAENTGSYLEQRITVINTDLDLRWSADKYLGEDAVFTGVIGRKNDHFTIVRNKVTYAVISMVGYGISVYDMRAVESNDAGLRCSDPAFKLAHNNFCTTIVPAHYQPVLEKIVNTRGDGKCPGEATPTYSAHQIQNIQFSAESVGIVPGHPDMDNPKETVYDHLALFGLDAHKGVLDMRYKLPTEAGVPINQNEDNGCVKRSSDGLVFYDVSAENAPRSIDRLHEIESKVANSTGPQRAPRFNSQTLFHWEVTAAQNSKGLRGSTPNTAVSRDYLLIGAGAYGMLIVEIGGTAPPSIASYSPLNESHLADVVWFAAGCYAIRVIPKTNLASVLDGNGHVLIVDLSNIDQRWLEPTTPGVAAQPRGLGEPFPLTHNAVIDTPIDPFDIGVNDPRIIYRSPYVYTTGVIPPIVDPQTGLSFGGDSITRDMHTAALFDPPVEVIADIGNNKLEPITGIVPLGVPAPPKDPSKKPTEDGYAFPKGSLAAFRIRVTLPGDIAHALSDVEANQKLQFALESELMPGQLSMQTPLGTPQSHLRRSTRDGHKEDRAVDLVFKHEIQIDPSIDVDKDFRHQSSYNRLVSPWIVAIADPRASEHVVGDSDAKKKLGCVNCDRPDTLHDLTEDKGVYELFTNGRTISIRPDSNIPETKMSDALKGAYTYLGKNGRLELHVPTTMADTVRGPALTVSAQAPPVANGALSETTYVHSGEVEINAFDLSINGRAGHDIILSRTHRSRTIGSTVLGSGWEAPFLRRLRQLPNGDVEYRDGGGEIWLFKPAGASSGSTSGSSAGGNAADTLDTQFGTKIKYVSPKGVYLKLARNENGWMLYDQQWRIARFDNYGRLTSESDEFWKKPDSTTSTTQAGSPPPPVGEVGNTIFYVYDNTGRLSQIFDPVGRKVNFEYWLDKTTPNDPAYACTQPNADRTQPCKFAGRLSKITDVTRNRELLFEYDKDGRLIAVQRPKFKGPDFGPAEASSSTDARRPRLTYEYKNPQEPATNEALQSQTWTDFMDFSGNIAMIFDAAENAPSAAGAQPQPRPRVRFDYEQTAGNVNRDRVTFQYWPCGNIDGSNPSNCSGGETSAKFQYPSADKTNVTDMLGQERDYEIIDLPNPIVPPATEPDPQNYRFKHISRETLVNVPTMEKTAPPVGKDDATQDTPLVTSVTDFDEEGAVKTLVLPNGATVEYETEAAHNGAIGRITKKIKETRGAEKRYTRFTYDTNADNPNSANTPVKVGRSSDDSNYTDRDTQYESRERKTVQQRDSDPDVKTKTETTFDDYGRITTHERRVDHPDVGSGALVTQTKVTYKDSANAPDLEKGRVDHVKSEAQGSQQGGQSAPIDTEFHYTDLGDGAEEVEAHDVNRNIHTYTDYDALDRPIHVKVDQGNDTLSEQWTGYDASGHVIYSARRQDASTTVKTFFTIDPLGRTVETHTGATNKILGQDKELSMVTKFSVTDHTITTNDPVILGTNSPLAKTVATLDKLGRTETNERISVNPPPGGSPLGTSPSQTEKARFAYDMSGQLAFSTDTVRGASYTVHDAFGRPQLSFSADGIRSKLTYDEWDQELTQQILGTDNGSTVIANAAQKYTADGHPRFRNEQIDLRVRQTFSVWKDGGKTTGTRTGKATGITGDMATPTLPDHIRATERAIDGHGRVTEEIYGSATSTTDTISQIHRRTFGNFQGDAPQETVEYSSLRNNASVTTNVVLDGLDRVTQSTVGGQGGYQTITNYDAAGNVTHIAPPGNVGIIDRKFDGRGLTYEEKRSNDTIQNFYDERGTLRRYTDETLHDTFYDVDALGRVSKITYPDLPLNTTEEFRYEDKTGLLQAHKDRKNVWLNYYYDEGGRTTEIKTGDPHGIQTTITSFDYDQVTRRITRVTNKDSAIEFSDYDNLGRARKTVMYRYSGGTGLLGSGSQQLLDVHSQTHHWSIFDGERSDWRMPVTGSAASGNNASGWLTSIIETRDASTNVTHMTGGASIDSDPAGVGELKKRSRTIGTQKTIDSIYGYTDITIPSPGVGIDPQPQSGMPRNVETHITSGNPQQAGPTLAGSTVWRNTSGRIGAIDDLAFTARQSRFAYDTRGRVNQTKLLFPRANIGTLTPVTDHHNEATFRDKRDTAGLLSSGDISTLIDQQQFPLTLENSKLALSVEPPKWTAADTPAHQIASKTLYLDGQPLLTGNNNFTYKFEFEGGRRKSDGIWKSDFDEFGRLMSIENDDRRIEYTYDPRGRIIGRTANQKNVGGATPTWIVETRASVLPGDGLPAETTWVWDPVVDRLLAIYEAGKSLPPSGSTQAPPPEAGLVRQYLHGDRGYDDPVEVLIAPQAGATPVKYFPVFDEAGTDSLQAVLDKDGNVVERALYGDAFGDAPHYLQGPSVEKISYENAGATVDIRIHASEEVKQLTIDNGVRLVALDAAGSVTATAPTPTLDQDLTTIHWHFDAGDWNTFIAGAAQIRVAITPSLRAYSWGDVPFSPAPEFAKKLYTVQSGSDPLVVTETLTYLASLNGEQPLYEIKSIYMAGLPYSKTKLLTGFQALPYNEPANGLIFARARWYDPATGTFLTPDPIGYHDASSLYAFAGGDPVNERDPLGLQEAPKDDPKDMEDCGCQMYYDARAKEAEALKTAGKIGRAGYQVLDIATDFAPGIGVLKIPIPFVEAYKRGGRKELTRMGLTAGMVVMISVVLTHRLHPEIKLTKEELQLEEKAEFNLATVERQELAKEARAITDPRRLLPPAGETTKSLEEIQRMKTGYDRGHGFNKYLAELNRARQEVVADTKLGRRIHDVGHIPGITTQLRIEGKNYRRFLTVNGQRVKGAVPLSKEIKTQIQKDVLFMREGRKQGIDRLVQWEFGGAGPSEELAKYLQRWRIPYVQH